MAAKVQVSLKGLICSERLDTALFGASEPRKASSFVGETTVCLVWSPGSRVEAFFNNPVALTGSQKGNITFTPVSLCGWPTLASSCLEIFLPSPTLNAFETVIPPSSVYSKLFNWLIPLNLGALVVCFLVSNSITDARQPFIPP